MIPHPFYLYFLNKYNPRRALFGHRERESVFRKLPAAQDFLFAAVSVGEFIIAVGLNIAELEARRGVRSFFTAVSEYNALPFLGVIKLHGTPAGFVRRGRCQRVIIALHYTSDPFVFRVHFADKINLFFADIAEIFRRRIDKIVAERGRVTAPEPI